MAFRARPYRSLSDTSGGVCENFTAKSVFVGFGTSHLAAMENRYTKTHRTGSGFSPIADKKFLDEVMQGLLLRSLSQLTPCLLLFPCGFTQSLHRPMLEVLGLVDLHYVVGALLLVVAVMGVLAGHLRHHLLLQVRDIVALLPLLHASIFSPQAMIRLVSV